MARRENKPTVCAVLTPKVICLTTLPSAHGTRGQSGAVATIAPSAARR
jgi:hypothetical protein